MEKAVAKELKVRLLSKDAKIPTKATKGSACYDVYSPITETIGLGVTPIGTNLAFEVPTDYLLEIRPRSGLASRGITIANSPGTLDSDYRGELIILLLNLGGGQKIIRKGDRIAQIRLTEATPIEFVTVEELGRTTRGEGGLGSTG